jgi:hypothetical protein
VKRVFSICLGITPIVLNWYTYDSDSAFTDRAGSRRPRTGVVFGEELNG